jgi:hypothetical protein
MKKPFTFQDLFENRRKVLKILKESKFIWIRAQLQCCRWNPRIARKAVQVAIPLGELKLKLKNGGCI